MPRNAKTPGEGMSGGLGMTAGNVRIDNPWVPLLSAGLKVLESWAAPPSRETNGGHRATGTRDAWIETDGSTGRPVLKLPLPEPEVLEQLTVALSRLVASFKR